MQTADQRSLNAHRRHSPRGPTVQAAQLRPPGGRRRVTARQGERAEHPPRRPATPRAAQARPPPPQPPSPGRARRPCGSAQVSTVSAATGSSSCSWQPGAQRAGLHLFSHMLSFHTENNPEETRGPDLSRVTGGGSHRARPQRPGRRWEPGWDPRL